MSEQKISKLTSEQEALIPNYREKWKKIALSTERIDREKAAEATKQAYEFIDAKEPEILFFKSPCHALQYLSKHINLEFECKIPNKYGLRDELTTQFNSRLGNKLQKQCRRIWILLENQLNNTFLIELYSSIERDLKFKGLYSSFSRFITFQRKIFTFCAYPQK